MDHEPSFLGDPPAAAVPDAMPDRRELALVAVERTRMPMVVTDPRQPDNPIVLANGAFLSLTGYRADEVLGRNCRFMQGPETDPDDVGAIRRGLLEGADQVSREVLNYRKDGSTFWNRLAINRVTDESGTLLYHFASQIDVTESRRLAQMEAMERHLLMEVDHRAANALALVQSVVRLTRADTVGAYASAVMGRVGALAGAHRLLARSGWTGADLRELLGALIPAQDEARVVLGGAPFRLEAQLVQPLALVLHELVSNARAHGALARDGGRVEVEWAEGSGAMALDWRERGAAALEGCPEPGFGLRILVGVVERQLGGEVATFWDGPGFRARIRVPRAPAPA